VLREDVRKRGQGMPLQYITGTAPFRYLEVEVAPGVLIPRPETEVLVSEALALLPPAPKPQDAYDAALLAAYGVDEAGNGEEAGPSNLLVADICTGSGCIACSIATEHPGVKVVATDLAPEAVALASRNVERFDVANRIEVVQGDLGECIDESLMGCFDLVVSNPPYVPTAVLSDIPREVADYEPALALDGGPDGLDIFRRLVTWAIDALKPGGGFACELHETCLEAAASIVEASGFTGIRIVNDLTGRPRVLVARKSKAS
jgi:release factor glutamine methyltransferase